METIIDDILVVKVGTNVLTGNSEWLDPSAFERIGAQILSLKEDGVNPIIISSAAIAAGMEQDGQTIRPDKATEMPELQRLASIGWRHVLNRWGENLPSVNVGELLLTKNELDLPNPREEVLHTTRSLLQHGDIPIANENDAVSHQEITYGDNDPLGARFAAKIALSKMFGNNVKYVILSDIDGIYEVPSNPDSVISTIVDLSELAHLEGDHQTSTDRGSGGISSKISAANIAQASGVPTFIANGNTPDAIRRALSGEIGTRIMIPA